MLVLYGNNTSIRVVASQDTNKLMCGEKKVPDTEWLCIYPLTFTHTDGIALS